MTYSIVARSPETGELGVAIQSHFFGAGRFCPWVQSGVGAVVTQAMAEFSYGPLALDLLRGGKSPDEALRALTAADAGAATRQVAIVDNTGVVAVHTGDRCIAAAGHHTGEGYSVQANMMRDEGVPEAMATAYEQSDGEPFAARLLAALDAGEAAGGDIRGRQSAGMVVAAAGDPPWKRSLDLRVDDHPEPLVELRRHLDMHRAYEGADDAEARAAMGTNPELRFWRALGLGRAGHVDAARRELSGLGEHWEELLRRLPAAGLAEQQLVDDLLPDAG
jgi:uncharacterized Ntn-hydrolase superfamily protein